eukprot:4868771-Alexandrium_andersonii.AAC.1
MGGNGGVDGEGGASGSPEAQLLRGLTGLRRESLEAQEKGKTNEQPSTARVPARSWRTKSVHVRRGGAPCRWAVQDIQVDMASGRVNER